MLESKTVAESMRGASLMVPNIHSQRFMKLYFRFFFPRTSNSRHIRQKLRTLNRSAKTISPYYFILYTPHDNNNISTLTPTIHYSQTFFFFFTRIRFFFFLYARGLLTADQTVSFMCGTVVQFECKI